MKKWEVLMGLLAIATAIWAQIKMVLHWLRGFVIAKKWTDRAIADTVVSFLQAKRSVREPAYSMELRYIRSKKAYRQVVFEEMTASGGIIWNGYVPIRMTKQEKAKGGNSNDDDAAMYTFEFIRGTVDWEELLRLVSDFKSDSKTSWKSFRYKVTYHHGRTLGGEIARERNAQGGSSKEWEKAHDRSAGQRVLHHDPSDLGGDPNPSSYGGLALSPALLSVVGEIKKWKKSKNWYQERGIPWRHGMMFHGSPGTGKTSFARATAEELDYPVHIFDLATMSNEDLREAWTKMAADAPCMAIIEDIDSVFNGRENKATMGGMMSSGGLTFDALLNCVDGIERHDGVLFIVSTNHPDKVDDALKNRAGRIDRIVEFLPLDFDSRLKIAKNILGDVPEAAKIAMECEDIPASRFVDICCKKALDAHYTEPKVAASGPYR